MKTLAGINYDLDKVSAMAAELEAMGADYIAAPELEHDPVLQLTMAAASTSKAKLMTSIAVAFGRSPMTLAVQAHDVNCLSNGRFVLGLGSQIKPHIEKRYSMPWSKPAARMKEYVSALKAIWACWYEGEPLNFEGEFYTHKLMTPMFTPSNKSFGAPPVYCAAVGPIMTASAAEVADGILFHSFMTEEYIRQVMMPAIEKGAAKSGRTRADLKLVGSSFIVTGETEEQFKRVKQAVCGQLSFYGSTPAYKPVLDSVGYGDLHFELLKLSKEGKWLEMGGLIDDALLDKFALVGEVDEIASKMNTRFGDLFDVSGASLMGSDTSGGLGYVKNIGDAIKAI